MLNKTGNITGFDCLPIFVSKFPGSRHVGFHDVKTVVLFFHTKEPMFTDNSGNRMTSQKKQNGGAPRILKRK